MWFSRAAASVNAGCRRPVTTSEPAMVEHRAAWGVVLASTVPEQSESAGPFAATPTNAHGSHARRKHAWSVRNERASRFPRMTGDAWSRGGEREPSVALVEK
jgi:hypothetical protein